MIDTVWDVLNVAYDLGKVGVGYATGNDQLVEEGWIDAGIDAGSALIPFVPAGSSKVARMAGEGIEAVADARKAPADSVARMVEGNGAAPGQAVADRGSKQASDIGKQADAGKEQRVTSEQLRRTATYRENKARERAESDGKCQYCQERDASTTDHIEPVKNARDAVNSGNMTKAEADSYINRQDNLVDACTTCNPSKGAKEVSLTPEPGKWTPSKPSERAQEKIQKVCASGASKNDCK